MTHYYCSVFSNAYVHKGLLLYNSLLRWDKDFHFFIVCLHQEAEQLFVEMNLEHATIISLSAVEKEDRQLAAVKKYRNDKEYVWTAKASVMLYLLKHYQQTDHIVWLDGDTYFYSNPAPIFDEWDDNAILLTEERWRKADQHKINRYGRYNTGFMGFKRNRQAIGCLQWFRRNLIKWCYDKHELGLWSDQIYVNDWLTRFSKVGVIKNKGVNVTPYIIMGSQVTKQGDDIYVDGERLVFFHPYGFRCYDQGQFELCIHNRSFTDDVIKWIYLPYMQACTDIIEQVQNVSKKIQPTTSMRGKFVRNYYNLAVNNSKAKAVPNLCTLFSKDYLVQGLALYYSLKRHTPQFHLWILCMDEEAYNLLENLSLSNVTLIDLENLMTNKLKKIRRERQQHEFCWTVKPLLLTYLLKNNVDLDSLLYLDADLFFFSDIGQLYDEWKENSVYITKLWLSQKWARKVGKYSAGLVGFKRDDAGMRCLQSWRKKCLRWCYDKQENGLWGDQKYLDKWPQQISAVTVSESKGINAGPWNIRRCYNIFLNGDNIYGNTQLVCYHFSGFRIIDENKFRRCDRKRLPAKADSIYAAYIEEIKKSMTNVKSVDSKFLQAVSGERTGKSADNFLSGMGDDHE